MASFERSDYDPVWDGTWSICNSDPDTVSLNFEHTSRLEIKLSHNQDCHDLDDE